MLYKHQHSSRLGSIISLVLVLAFVFAAYNYLAVRNARATTDNLVSVSAEDGVIPSPLTPEQQAMVSKISSLKIDDTFFTDETFISLKDWSVNLAPESAGKANPFAPLGTVQPLPAKTKAPAKR